MTCLNGRKKQEGMKLTAFAEIEEPWKYPNYGSHSVLCSVRRFFRTEFVDPGDGGKKRVSVRALRESL